jgi:hypothetical protein
MGPFVRRLSAASALATLVGCAANNEIAPLPAPPPSMAATAPPPQDPPPPNATSSTGLTAATVSTTEPTDPNPNGWTDPQIAAVLVAAADGDAREAAAVLDLTHSQRIQRFAEHMRSDDRILGERVREVAARIGTGDSATRLQVDVERTGFLVAVREAPDERVDTTFLRAQTVQCASLVHLIDTELLGAAQDRELIAVLREVRAGALHHLQTAKDIEENPRGSHLGHTVH